MIHFKRFCVILVFFSFIASCSRLAPAPLLPEHLKSEMVSKCESVYLDGKWQLTHSIEVSFPGNRKTVMIGVTELDQDKKRAHCVLMTLEGFVLFEAISTNRIRVKRAVPPFDAPGFAKGLMDDISLIFFKQGQGNAFLPVQLKAGAGCRQTIKNHQVVDLVPSSGSTWKLFKFDKNGRLTRSVEAKGPSVPNRRGAQGLPETITLSAHGSNKYKLVLRRIDAIQIRDD